MWKIKCYVRFAVKYLNSVKFENNLKLIKKVKFIINTNYNFKL